MFQKRKKRPITSAVIVAAGRASRMEGLDKQLLEIGGVPVVVRSILAFERSPLIDEVILVTRPDLIPELNRLVQECGCRSVRAIVAGGETRQESVFRGVRAADPACEFLAIHDGARPLVSTEAVERCLRDAWEHGAALLSVPVKDTVKRADGAGFIAATVDRAQLYNAQTPQIFAADLYRRAMDRAEREHKSYTDDCQLIESLGQKVFLSRGEYGNIKITTPEDLAFCEAFLQQDEAL